MSCLIRERLESTCIRCLTCTRHTNSSISGRKETAGIRRSRVLFELLPGQPEKQWNCKKRWLGRRRKDQGKAGWCDGGGSRGALVARPFPE